MATGGYMYLRDVLEVISQACSLEHIVKVTVVIEPLLAPVILYIYHDN
jgi:hypothetical protein